MKYAENFKLLLITALGGVTLSACTQSQYNDGYGQYGADSSQYGSGPAQYNSGYAQSRYGGAAYSSGGQYASGGLRTDCSGHIAPCGFMQVVPVYPIYQVEAAPAPAPVIEHIPEPVVEIFEPAPTIIVEPEPVFEPYEYTPRETWPELETPAPVWTPIRK